LASRVNQKKYEVITSRQWLVRFNRSLRAEHDRSRATGAQS
jgi:hypothetical protein